MQLMVGSYNNVDVCISKMKGTKLKYLSYRFCKSGVFFQELYNAISQLKREREQIDNEKMTTRL